MNLANFKVQELSTQEKRKTEGGFLPFLVGAYLGYLAFDIWANRDQGYKHIKNKMNSCGCY